jgi:hypothetical protein
MAPATLSSVSAGAPPLPTRCACVIVGAAPDAVAAIETSGITIGSNRHGTLVTGDLGTLPLDYADSFDGPIYDVMFNPSTGWFSVTIFDGDIQPVRFDNRPGTDPGYPRVDAILGASTPEGILEVLDIPAALLASSEQAH